MTRKKPETPEEQWQALGNFGRGAEERDIDEMSDDEVKAVLEAYALDLEKVERDGQAFVEWLFKQTDEGAPVPGAVTAAAEALEGSGEKAREPAANDAPRKTIGKPRTPEERLQAIVDTVRDAEVEEMEATAARGDGAEPGAGPPSGPDGA